MQTITRIHRFFQPTHYRLSLDIDRPNRSFSGTVSITGSSMPDAAAIFLHSKGLDITSVTFDGKKATFSLEKNDTIKITHNDLQPGEHIVVVGFNGNITDAMHGMYPCKFTHAGEAKELIATQFESHHAREAFPCIDEPEAKATFDVILTTEPGVTVLGNLHHISQIEENGKLVTTFATTPKMSTYLLAWVYGDLHKKTAYTKGNVEVNVWATPAQSAESFDFALDHAVKSIEFFDDYFQTAYPLPKSDHVALPDFSSAAMENWGLITYRESCLLADPSTTTVANKQLIATVISHELSHQWFGNLVTMKWWDNLWLNESFATLMEYIAVDAIHPEWNSWLEFSAHESVLALRRDAIDGVQPVQVDVHHPDEITSLFDGAIVYAKGARLMRMCQIYIGDKAFQKGLQSYFSEFVYANTEADDLWRHLSHASDKDISHFMNTWISQSGYPVVTVASDSLSQEQFFIGEHEQSTKLWPIPLNAESKEDVPALLETETLHLPVADDERLNVGDSAHFITSYSDDHLSRILNRDDLSDLDKMQLLHEQTLLVRAEKVASVKLIDLIAHFNNESSEYVWTMLALAFGELKKFVENDTKAEQKLRQFAGKLAKAQYDRLGWSANAGEPEHDTKLRSTILAMMIYSQDGNVIAQAEALYTAGLDTIDSEIRSLVIGSKVYHTKDEGVVRDLLETYRHSQSPDLQQDICDGLTNVRQPAQINYLIDHLTDTSVIRPQDNGRWFAYLIRNRYAREAAWQWIRDQWKWIDATFGGDKSYDYYPRYAANGLVTSLQQNEYELFFTPLRKNPALTRTIDVGLKEIDGRVKLLERDGEAVRTRLINL